MRYTLLKTLGSGSFSSVVAALDNDTGEKVGMASEGLSRRPSSSDGGPTAHLCPPPRRTAAAQQVSCVQQLCMEAVHQPCAACHCRVQVALKRIPDVLNNAENAKRVLREVCILRRLSHPHIISLRDVFLKPSSTGEAWCGDRGQPRRDVQPRGEAGIRRVCLSSSGRLPASCASAAAGSSRAGAVCGTMASGLQQGNPLAFLVCAVTHEERSGVVLCACCRALHVQGWQAGADLTGPVPGPGVLRPGCVSREGVCILVCVCVCALAQECVHADCVCVCAQVETCMLACVCGDGRELLVGMLLFARNALLLFDDTAVLTPAVLL